MANLLVTLLELKDDISINENNALDWESGELKAIIEDAISYQIDWLL